MATTLLRGQSPRPFRYGNAALTCGSARVSAHCRSVATVVTVTGVVLDADVDCVAAEIGRFLLGDSPVVVDLSGVTSVSAGAVGLLDVARNRAHARRVEWIVVADPGMREFLQIDADRTACAPTVADALHDLVSESDARRAILLPLLARTA